MADPTRRPTRVPRLLDRVIQRRRKSAAQSDVATGDGLTERLSVLEERVEHLEAVLEGLQDSIHREGVRHEDEVAALERKTEPSQMARALGRHARERGL